MALTVTMEVPLEHEALMRRTLALAEELHQLALRAPDGTVFDACEAAVITKGRDVQKQMLEEAVARRIEAAEKKGRRSASVPVVVSRKTEAPRNGNSSAPLES